MTASAARIRHLPASGHVDMAWKNGLGRTAEIARQPASGDGFDWRVSIATIAADGPPSPGATARWCRSRAAGWRWISPTARR